MMSSTLGAPLGGTTLAGHAGLLSLASSLITPGKGCGGGGSWSPLIVVWARGEPGVPVVCTPGAAVCWACGAAAALFGDSQAGSAPRARGRISEGCRGFRAHLVRGTEQQEGRPGGRAASGRHHLPVPRLQRRTRRRDVSKRTTRAVATRLGG